MQERLYALSLDNFVRVSYQTDAPATGETADTYERAHETLDRWPYHRGKKSAGTEKGPYVTYNPLGLLQNHFLFDRGSCAELSAIPTSLWPHEDGVVFER